MPPTVITDFDLPYVAPIKANLADNSRIITNVHQATILWNGTECVIPVLAIGPPKAITAAAHKLARIFYRLWTSGDQFIDPGVDAYEQRYRERVVNNLKKKAQAFGLELTPISDPTQCVS